MRPAVAGRRLGRWWCARAGLRILGTKRPAQGGPTCKWAQNIFVAHARHGAPQKHEILWRTADCVRHRNLIFCGASSAEMHHRIKCPNNLKDGVISLQRIYNFL